MSFLSILAVRTSAALLQMVGRGGSLPGQIGLKLDPRSLSRLQFDGPLILVTGTNGKTSTANMITSAFEKAGKTVISNRKGDNLKEGITTALLSHTGLDGKLHGDAAVLEVDELNVRRVLPELPVSALVVNNFFRDQLDRAREMEQLIQSIEEVLPSFEGTLILNGNDPNTTRLALKAPKAKAVYFGIGETPYSVKENKEASEGKFCPRCAHPLHYDYYQYSHIGSYHCDACGFATPELDVELQDVDLDANTFSWNGHSFQAPYEGMYSMYNYAALLAAVKEFGLPVESVEEVFAHAPKPAGRNEHFEKDGQKIILNLVKNPTGANEVMKVIEKDDSAKTALLVLNDHEQDGRDVSWIYDTQFEKLMDPSTRRIVCAGTRANDLALRLYYGGYQGELLAADSIEEGLKLALQPDHTLYVVATYTALLPSRSAILKEGGK